MLPARELGYFPQGGFVKFALHHHSVRQGAFFRAHGDGINLDAQLGRVFRRHQRGYLAGVGGAVRHQDDDFGFGVLAVIQPGGRRRNGGADGRAVRLDHARMEVPDDAVDQGVVQRERTEGFGFPGKAHDADAVVRTAVDELGDDMLGGHQAVDGHAVEDHVRRLHGVGEVKGDHDVNAVDGAEGFILHFLGARQRDGEGRRRQHEANGPYFSGQGLGIARQGGDEANGRVGDGAFRPPPAAEDNEAQDEGKDIEPFRLCELGVFRHGVLALLCR